MRRPTSRIVLALVAVIALVPSRGGEARAAEKTVAEVKWHTDSPLAKTGPSEAGMKPKSAGFERKPRDGLVAHVI
jgi:hypothetical protein